MNLTKKIIYMLLLINLVFSKSLVRDDYLDGYVKFDLNNSNSIVAVLPFSGDEGMSASDYATLYLGKHTKLDIIERSELSKIVDEQDLFPDRLDDELRAEIRELFGADYIVLGKVWSNKHLSLVNCFLPWNWCEMISKHWFVRIRVINADTGEIVSSYYNRDGHKLIDLGIKESYLSEKMDEIIIKMYNDFNNIKEETSNFN